MACASGAPTGPAPTAWPAGASPVRGASPPCPNQARGRPGPKVESARAGSRMRPRPGGWGAGTRAARLRPWELARPAATMGSWHRAISDLLWEIGLRGAVGPAGDLPVPPTPGLRRPVGSEPARAPGSRQPVDVPAGARSGVTRVAYHGTPPFGGESLSGSDSISQRVQGQEPENPPQCWRRSRYADANWTPSQPDMHITLREGCDNPDVHRAAEWYDHGGVRCGQCMAGDEHTRR